MDPRYNPQGTAAIPADKITTSPATSQLMELYTPGSNGYTPATVANVFKANKGIAGIASDYKIARGQHVQLAASDTVVTGLTTVVAVIAEFDSSPTVKQLFLASSIGDQATTPVAGSVLLKTFKPTAVNDVTPTAATDFTENLKINWIAIGT
jgi:hypothetical protein